MLRHDRRAGIPLVFLALLVVCSSCGTRVADDKRSDAVHRLGNGDPGPEGPQRRGSDGPDAGSPGSSPQAERDPSPAGVSSAPSTPAASGPARREVPGVNGAPEPRPGTRDVTTGLPLTEAARTRRAPGDERAGVTHGSSPNTRLSRVRIASVGTWSGPFGNVLKPYLEALQVWVRWINDRGGVNGHLVDLVVSDDGGDPARHRALTQEMVERQGVVAFVMNGNGVSGRPTVPYINQKRVPVIGGEGGGQWYYESPMYFPQATVANPLVMAMISSVAARTVPKGLVKLGSLVCYEAQICSDAERIWNDAAPAAGFAYVYRGKASVAQPGFTAECLNARTAGVQVLIPVLPPVALSRLASDCARQNYRPILGLANSIASGELKDQPTMDGALVVTPVFPWVSNDLPAEREFADAMRTYAPGAAPGAGHTLGWVAAKLFEKAASQLPEPPTSAAILEGLWGLRDDTLGGLTHPLTFRRDEPARKVICWFNMSIRQRQYVADDGSRLHCGESQP